MIRVQMVPHPTANKDAVSGIDTVIRKWAEHFPDFGLQIVGPEDGTFDVMSIHAGMTDRIPNNVPMVSNLHGLYWSADYKASSWEWDANSQVIECARRAHMITVPSPWVAETIQRDMRVDPVVVPHGIDWKEWQHKEIRGNYVVGYAKNRAFSDVCDPTFLTTLAEKFPRTTFVSTFAPPRSLPNIRVVGVLPRDKMRLLLQRAAAVISPIKETFGVLTLEAFACGTPVLGFDYGGNSDLILHGKTGYLARVGDHDDLANGLVYCVEHRAALGALAVERAKEFTWDEAVRRLEQVYKMAISKSAQGPSVSVVIPCYKYGQEERLGRAIKSVQAQTVPVDEIIVVDDGSPDDGETGNLVARYAKDDKRIQYIRKENGGVAVARNVGCEKASSKYIICLDADDALGDQFVEACLPELEKDRTLGIAYTKLMTVAPNGAKKVSVWPDNFSYDRQLQYGGNQVPTACMFRREMWERLGGYRSRYCPNGAGSEDAEFWLRSGAYGWRAKKATDAPLFLYSIGTGQVSGNKHYSEVDWHILHPWCFDNQHPFASIATPANERMSHAVRQYDEPNISVVIPVGPGHKQHVFNALDSLEAQTYRKWEVILVDDTGDAELWSYDGVTDMLKAYPYVRLVRTGGKKGAGFARNRGAEASRAPLLLFLDADDNLLDTDALQTMMQVWEMEGKIVYTDYMGKAVIDKNEAEKLKKAGRLIDFDPKTGLAMIQHKASEYDCERAIRQPANPLYIWNLITSLVPKSWHKNIGGFDESMKSWEDWDYWVRMARAGHCFVHVEKPMVVYRFYTGNRREIGVEISSSLLQYMAEKLSKTEVRMCGCKGKKTATTIVSKSLPLGASKTAVLADSEVVLITYQHPNRGSHRVIGPASKRDYGYRSGGGQEEFLIEARDQVANPRLFVIKPIVKDEAPPPEPPPPPPVIEEEALPVETASVPDRVALDFLRDTVDFSAIPGVTKQVATHLQEAGCKTLQDVLDMGKEKIMELPGVGPKRADAIYAFIERKIANTKAKEARGESN